MALWVAWNPAAAQIKASTTTTLAVTSASGQVATIASGTVVTLTATVNAGSTALTTGQVNFCDASAKYCADIHLLGMAQLTNAGTAVLKLRPGIGGRGYRAVFVGTNTYAGSSSNLSALTVTGTIPPLATAATINQAGNWGAYTLSATLTETGNTNAPTGLISFLDTNHGNAVLGTGTLGTATRGVNWTSVSSSAPSVAGVSYAVADLNGDGIPDLFVKDYFGTYDVLLGKGDGTFTPLGDPFGPYSQTGPFILGDFNNDGIPDVAAIHSVYYAPNNTITIFLGNGDGTFTVAGSSPAIGMSPSGITTADINGDGNADLVVSQTDSSGNGELVVFFGHGDGTFTQVPSPISVRSTAASITPIDINRDGNVDLVLSGNGQSGITLLLGKGDGTFTVLAGPAQAGEATASVADLNNDGFPDLVFEAATTSYLTVFLGNGDGTFTAAPSSPTANFRTGNLSIGDFTQDGIPDIVYVAPGTTGIGLLVGKGDGTFLQASATVAYAYDFSGVFVVADFNGDGWPDVLTEDGNSRTVIDSLTQPTETATASATVSIAAAGAHLADASYPGDSNYNASTSGTVSLWGVPPATTTVLTLTSGGTPVTSVLPGSVVTLTATVKAGTIPVTAGQVNFCDASASQCTDIHLLGAVALSSSGTAAFKFVPGPGTHSYKAVFAENGFGMISSSPASSLTVGPSKSLVYTDTTAIGMTGFAGDYTLTATVVGYGGSATPTGSASFLDTSFGNTLLATAPLGASTAGLGWLISQTPATGPYPASEVTGDFNGDGIPDLAVLWGDTTYGGSYSVSILLGIGDGTFSSGPTAQLAITGQSNVYMIAADINGDGRTDLAVLSWNTSLNTSFATTLLGRGDGTFAAGLTSPAFNQGVVGGDSVPGSMVAADFNGDGKMDLAVVGDYISSGGVTILLGKGDGTFTAAGPTLVPKADFGGIATGDFNGDGVPDLVATNYFTFGGSPTIFLGKGDGTFTTLTMSLTLDYFPTSIVVGDFNGDGVLDLAFSDLNGVEIALGNGDGTFKETSASPITVPSELNSLKTGDFNHDGKLDIAGVDSSDDRIVVLVGAGDGSFTVTSTTPAVSQNWLGPFAIVAADFNKDGVPDLAMLTKNQATASILLTEPTQTVSATVNGIAPIGAGTHDVDASYAGDANYSPSVSSTVPLTAGLAPIVISPTAGTYTSVQTITLSESIPGATIYYSLMGSVSTAGFVPYTGPITLSAAGVEYVQAYATEAGYQQSDSLIALYTLVLPPTATPTISLASGYYSGTQIVTIIDSMAGAKIYYTINGTLPTVNSNLYSGPITISTSETLVAAAVAYGYAFSPGVAAQYIIGSSSPSLIYTIAGSGTYGYLGDNGPATMAQLDSPIGVVKDSAGNVYFSDAANHMVRKIAAGTGVITRIAGTQSDGYSGDGGPATSAELSYPSSLALDSLGNLFISDNGNQTIRKIDLASGIITTYAGNPAATTPGDGGQATAAALSSISGIAIDVAHNVYIAETYPGVIRVVTDGTGIVNTIAGSGAYGYSGDGGPAINATFRSLYGIALDGSGNLYIADSDNNLIRKITATNGIITRNSIISTAAGTISAVNGNPQAGYGGDGGPATSAQLNRPIAVAIDNSANVYISDSNNSVIRKVTAGSGIISTVTGNGVACRSYGGDGDNSTSASLCYPRDIAVDAGGNLYIADQSSNRIREAFAPGTPPSTQAAVPVFSLSSGTYGIPQTVTVSDSTPGAAIYVTVDGSTPTTARASGYSFPINVAGALTIGAIATAPGYLTSALASATYQVTSFSPVITTVAGKGTMGFAGAGGPALDVQFGMPQSIAVDKAGNIYVSDSQNNVVWSISAATGNASLFAGNGTQGYSGDGVLATSAKLRNPQGIALDSADNLYIADVNNGAIRKVNATTGIISTIAGGAFNMGGAMGDGGPATSASLMYPYAVALDGTDNLYIADTEHHAIREVSAKTGIITTVAGNGTYIVSGDGGPATKAGVQQPNLLAVDRAGNIYLGSSNSARVRKVSAATGLITTVAGLDDIRGSTGDGGAATSAEISPESISVDSAGNLYLSNWPSQIRKVDTNTGVITKVAGIGFWGFTGDGGVALDAELLGPTGIAFNSAGDLYFADTYNYRIRKVTFTEQPAATPAFSIAPGTYATAQSVDITDITPGAVIYYTTDGTTPSASATAYSGPIAVNSTQTIKAMATASDYSASAVASATYVIGVPAAALSLSSLTPAFSSAGSAAFTLTVKGAGFTAASTINWAATALTTHNVSATELTAQVTAAQAATAGVISVVVQTPAPGGGTSNALSFEIDTAGPETPPSFTTNSVTVTAGASATYPVTLPSSAANVSVKCLNLPSGATCSYSASMGAVTVITAATTPAGTYQITAVFTEALPGAAAALAFLPLLLLPFASCSKRKGAHLLIVASAGLLFAVLAAGAGCGGGGGTPTPPPTPQTHQVTSSATIILIVK